MSAYSILNLRSFMRSLNISRTRLTDAPACHAQSGAVACRMMASQTGEQPKSEPRGDPSGADEPLPDPPNAFTTVLAMGSGAVGAVAIAAVGVIGVFKLALWVAESSGRSMTRSNPSGGTAEPVVVVVPPAGEPAIDAARRVR